MKNRHASLGNWAAPIRARLEWIVWPAVGILSAVVLLAPLIRAAGVELGEAYSVFFSGAFGSAPALGRTLRMATPLILIGIGISVCYRAGLFNIGGEGQLLAGATLAILTANALGERGGPWMVPLLLVVGAIGGAAWGSVAAFLRGWREINEVITTIMLNFVALFAVQYLVTTPFRDPDGTYAATPQIPDAYRLPLFEGPARIHYGLILALLAVLFVHAVMKSTRTGYKLRVVGMNTELAMRKGISPRQQYLIAFLVGGGLAGLGGTVDALAIQYRMSVGFSPGWGFDAIAVALLARANIIAVIPVAIFFGGLRNGATILGRTLAVPGGIVFMVQAVPVIIVAIAMGLRARRHSIAAT